MPSIEDILLYAISQDGDRYVWGGKGDPLDPDPDGFDCSGLVTWACERAGVEMSNGAYWQWKHCLNAGMQISVDEALNTRGALMFVARNSDPQRFDDVPHVVFSLGDHTTMEARGTRYGVGTWAGDGRFQLAALIPGVDYGAASGGGGAPGQDLWVPEFPLPDGSFFGPEGLGNDSVSGWHSHREDLRVWQAQMLWRGWSLGPDGADGLFGNRGQRNPAESFTGRCAIAFQKEKQIGGYGIVETQTWQGAWTEPVT